ncbi:MAG TPA: phytanoyl-CoA dioxygenase family protein [Fimbriimonadaceae bacterium]|nr:phytanoyl-CoA dioxygenase family protein [Fimbriimonadaceae bacterium]
MLTRALPPLFAGGRPLDPSERCFGFLRSSIDFLGDAEALRGRMGEDGYLFLPGFFDREEVRSVRLAICEKLAEEGCLDPGHPVEQAIAREGVDMAFRPDLANASDPLKGLVYGDRLMGFYDHFLGGKARHYDFTWMRAVSPGNHSDPHCDIVYMGRGTPNVYTAWVPLGDVPIETGGLIVLENSHKNQSLKSTYGQMDVDTACENKDSQRETNAHGYPGFGALSDDAPALREQLGGRWLTADFRMGDLLTFPMFTVHASLDNRTREIRLSSDSRYQLASEPVDERWVGENPPGHGGKMIKSMIC